MKQKLPTWDLSDLYRSINDPAINRDLKAYLKRAKTFERKYKNKLSKVVRSSREFYRAIDEYETILQNASKPVQYASLIFSETSADPKRGAFQQRMRAEYLKIHQHMIFFELQLMQLPQTEFRKLLTGRAFQPYRNYFQKLSDFRSHKLSEAEERLISDRDLTGRRALLRLFEEEMGAKKYQVKKGNRLVPYSMTQLFELLFAPKRDVRRAGFHALSSGLKEESRRLAFIFNTLHEDKAVEDRYRQFNSPEAARHLDNQIDQATVDAMAGAVSDSYDVVQRYYAFKSKYLKLKPFTIADRGAPFQGARKQYSWALAKDLMIGSARGFSEEYADITKQFFSKRWIDAAARPGKRGGGFCSFITPDLHPYIFINYTGSLKEVFTLAHELGHGVHAYLMREQSYLNFDTPLTVAETASVFGEMLAFEELLKRAKGKKERFGLYVDKIEGIFATVYRQISLYRFEQDFHAARRHGELGVPEINAIWRKRQSELYGRSITLEPEYDYWWSYIPHFLHTPFYVYAYAFGELLTLALYAEYKKKGDKFVHTYLDMLRSGGSKNPDQLLKPFGINLRQAKFWKGGVDIIRSMVSEAESLAS